MALDLPTLDGVIDDVGAFRDPRAGRLPAALRRRLPRRARGGGVGRGRHASSPFARRRTIPLRPHASTSPRRAACSATSRIHDFDAIRFVTGQDVVEVYADGGAIATQWFEEYGDFDTAVAVLRLSGGALRDPLGDTPRPPRLRRPARGLRHERQHRRRARRAHADPLGRAGRATCGRGRLRQLHRALRGRVSRRARRLRRRGARGTAEPVQPEDARAALAVAVAAERSCAERRPVRIDE